MEIFSNSNHLQILKIHQNLFKTKKLVKKLRIYLKFYKPNASLSNRTNKILLLVMLLRFLVKSSAKLNKPIMDEIGSLAAGV